MGKVTAISIAMTAAALMPFYLLAILVQIALMHERLIRKVA